MAWGSLAHLIWGCLLLQSWPQAFRAQSCSLSGLRSMFTRCWENKSYLKNQVLRYWKNYFMGLEKYRGCPSTALAGVDISSQEVELKAEGESACHADRYQWGEWGHNNIPPASNLLQCAQKAAVGIVHLFGACPCCHSHTQPAAVVVPSTLAIHCAFFRWFFMYVSFSGCATLLKTFGNGAVMHELCSCSNKVSWTLPILKSFYSGKHWC